MESCFANLDIPAVGEITLGEFKARFAQFGDPNEDPKYEGVLNDWLKAKWNDNECHVYQPVRVPPVNVLISVQFHQFDPRPWLDQKTRGKFDAAFKAGLSSCLGTSTWVGEPIVERSGLVRLGLKATMPLAEVRVRLRDVQFPKPLHKTMFTDSLELGLEKQYERYTMSSTPKPSILDQTVQTMSSGVQWLLSKLPGAAATAQLPQAEQYGDRVADVEEDEEEAELVVPCEVPALAWHPYAPRWAVARPDDSIRFYDLVARAWEPLSLLHAKQTSIQTLAWNPMGGSMLAVGCSTGVCLWHFVSGAASKHKTAWMVLLVQSSPVVSTSWSPCGRFLSSATAGGDLVVWDVAKAGLKSQGAITLGSATTCLWAPRAGRLLSSTGNSFKVWRRRSGQSAESEAGGRHWSHQAFSTRRPLQCAQWNRRGDVLLVAEQDSSRIHIVNFDAAASTLKSPETLELDEVEIKVSPNDKAGSPERLGGVIDLLCWSPESHRLAVSFKGQRPGQELVAVFDTNSEHNMVTTVPRPIGFIRGPGTKEGSLTALNKATSLTFCPHFDQGALLAIGWSQGQISMHPMYFQVPEIVGAKRRRLPGMRGAAAGPQWTRARTDAPKRR